MDITSFFVGVITGASVALCFVFERWLNEPNKRVVNIAIDSDGGGIVITKYKKIEVEEPRS